MWQRNPFSQNLAAMGRLVDRISGVMNSGLRFTGTLWVELEKYRTLEERYNQAKKTLEQYRFVKDKFDLLQRQNKYLRQALELKSFTEHPEAKAEILGVRLNSISPRIIISKGREHGIEPLMPVIARSHDHQQNLIRSLVGITVLVSNTTTVVQPIIHPSFQVGVRIGGSQEWAILSGNSGRIDQALLTYVTTNFFPDSAVVTRSKPLSIGKDRQVYTSGAGGIFPPGIPVGTVVDVGSPRNDFKTAYVKPFAPISQLQHVSVIIKKIENWSRTWDREISWQEQLKTEFGIPQYPKSTMTVTRKTRKTKRSRSNTISTNSERIIKKTKTVTPIKKKQIIHRVEITPRRLQNIDRRQLSR